ncbi:MAG: hypothetical protein OYL41_11120 [Acidobacteriota bacterium]|nr:hypothetical protein [Acidobacteriota bacterium]MDE3262519.1 hypothetical protein [Acidobacteriota bacterium]
MSATSAHRADGGTRPADSQLTLRFFALVDGMRRKPPERGLWRELLNLALGDVRAFVHGSRPVAAAAVWSVGWTLYGRADEAGIVEGFSVPIIAADSRLGERTVRGAVALLRQWRILKMERPSRRAPARWRMNLGGLDWPAVRARVERERTDPSPVTMTGLSPVTMTGLKCYNVELPISDPDLAAGTPRARRADQERQEQQQPDLPPGDENLLRAIAGRSREHDVPFAEAAVRRRLAAGELNTVDLFEYLNNALPPRMNTQDPEAQARFDADEAAGRVDRNRKGGYPAPPDDPRFTMEDEGA